MLQRATAPIDPATFEVLNHRLLNIVEEMGIQYMRCSGSNVLITGNDAATAIMLPDGALVSVGPYIVTQGNVLPLIVESTMRLAADVGYNDGDIFICNDPYLGAIHAPDFATVAPIFHAGELVAWIGASGHQLDTGGMDPGGFSVKAVDVHQEGLRMPPVKLVEAGRVREDVYRWIINQVRDPLVGLDVRGQIAALNAGRARIAELIEAWGVDNVKAVMRRSIEHARDKLAARLASCPTASGATCSTSTTTATRPRSTASCAPCGRRGPTAFDFAGRARTRPGLINSTWSGLPARCCRPSTSISAGTSRGIAACGLPRDPRRAGTSTTPPIPRLRDGDDFRVIVTIDVTWRCLAHLFSGR